MSASLRRVGAIAATTFTELARLRVFYVLVLFALVLIVSSTFLSRISFQQELQVTKDIALGAINFFLCLLAIVATAQLLPRDLEDRVVYSVLAKPVRRFEYVLGKFFGMSALLLVSLAAMSLLCLFVIHQREEAALRETHQQVAHVSPDQDAAATRAIREAGVNPTLAVALGLMLLKAAILVAITLAVSTFATSSIFTISAMAMIYLIGHMEGIARDYWLHAQSGSSGLARALVAFVVFVFPDLQAFNLPDQLAGASLLAPGQLGHLVGLGAFYIVSYLLIGIAAFEQREL